MTIEYYIGTGDAPALAILGGAMDAVQALIDAHATTQGKGRERR